MLRKKARKSISVGLAGLMFGSLALYGCSGSGAGGDGAHQEEVTSDTEITVYTSAINEDEYGDAFKQMVEDNLDFKVNFESEPLLYADTVNKATTMFASGDDSVDVYFIDEIMQLSFLSADFLEPLDDVVTDSDISNILEGYADKFLVRDGHIYGVPADFGGILFFVNKKMFDEAGVAIPTNQEEFLAAASFDEAGKYGEEIICAPMPTFKTNKTPMSSWMWVVNKNSAKKEAAKEYVKFMATPEAQAAYMKATGKFSPTANLSVWEDPELTTDLLTIEEHKLYVEEDAFEARTLCPRHSEYMDTVTGTLQEYLMDEISFEECLEKGQQQIDELLNN